MAATRGMMQRRSWLIKGFIILHLALAVDSLLFPLSIHATHMALFTNHVFAGIVFLAVAILAHLGTAMGRIRNGMRTRRIGATLTLFQQVILILGIIGPLTAVVQGMYADGTIIPREQIFADQFVYIVLAVAHAFEWWDYHWGDIIPLPRWL